MVVRAVNISVSLSNSCPKLPKPLATSPIGGWDLMATASTVTRITVASTVATLSMMVLAFLLTKIKMPKQPAITAPIF